MTNPLGPATTIIPFVEGVPSQDGICSDMAAAQERRRAVYALQRAEWLTRARAEAAKRVYPDKLAAD